MLFLLAANPPVCYQGGGEVNQWLFSHSKCFHTHTHTHTHDCAERRDAAGTTWSGSGRQQFLAHGKPQEKPQSSTLPDKAQTHTGISVLTVMFHWNLVFLCCVLHNSGATNNACFVKYNHEGQNSIRREEHRSFSVSSATYKLATHFVHFISGKISHATKR